MPRTEFTPRARPASPAKPSRSRSPKLLELGMQAVKLLEEKRRAKERLEDIERRESEHWTSMIEAGLGFGDTIVGGKVRLRRSWRAGPITVSFAKARDANALTPQMLRALEPFTSIADPYEEWEPKLLTGAIAGTGKAA